MRPHKVHAEKGKLADRHCNGCWCFHTEPWMEHSCPFGTPTEYRELPPRARTRRRRKALEGPEAGER